MGWGTAAWLLLRDELLELVETVHLAIPVKRATRRRLEPALGVDDLRRLATIPKRQLHQRFDVVGIWGSQTNATTKRAGGSTSRNSPANTRVAVGRLHLDPVAGPDVRTEPEARDSEPLRPPTTWRGFSGSLQAANTTSGAAGNTRFISSVISPDGGTIPLTVFRPPLGAEKFPSRLLRLARIAVVTSGPNAAARWCGRTAGQESNRIRCLWENECASLLRSTDEPAPRHRRDRGDRRRGPAPIAPCPSVRA